MDSIKTVVRDYYEGWAEGDLARSRGHMDKICCFKSPQDKFQTADQFFEACSHLSEGLVSIKFLREIYSGDEAFVILEWYLESGATFMDAEYLKMRDGKIVEIIVLNNSPDFTEMIG